MRLLGPLVVLALAASSGCGGHNSPAGGANDAPAQPSPDARSSPMPDSTPLPPDAAPFTGHLCNAPPPEGAAQPEPPPAYAGTCPVLAAGMNTITSSTKTRTFMLVLPASPSAGEVFPVMFMWYWLGGSAQDFYDKGEVQQAADASRFIAVIPVDEGADVLGTSFNTHWPFDITQSQPRMDEEFQFFDDMLSCVEQELPVNQSCVSSAGVSAGALFTDQLAQARSTRLSSFISLSGGVNDTIIRGWSGMTHKMPGIVLWGGDGPPTMDGVKDILGCFGIGMDFSVASKDMETGLVDDGQFFIECKHNCGHVEPPIPPVPGESIFQSIWDFALDHPYWLAPGDSPYLKSGLPTDLPPWCGIGANSAVPRSGSGCPPAENPCTE